MARQLNELELEEKNAIFNSFRESCVHHEKLYITSGEYTRKTHAIVEYNATERLDANVEGNATYERFYVDSTGAHAEMNVVQELEKRLDAGTKRRIKIYLSFSPCNDCSDTLTAFKVKYKNVEIEIVFANLYNIKRESCINSCNRNKECENHIAYSFICPDPREDEKKKYATRTGKHLLPWKLQQAMDKEKESEKYKDGLKKLSGVGGITLRTFSPGDWEFLRRVLEVQDPKREQEDKRMAEDLKAILGPSGAGAGGAGPEPDEVGVGNIRKMMDATSLGE